MTFEEAMDPETIVTKKQALREVLKHGASREAFLKEVGDKPEYKGYEVLLWLGY